MVKWLMVINGQMSDGIIVKWLMVIDGQKINGH
jgi:hypothetical protein